MSCPTHTASCHHANIFANLAIPMLISLYIITGAMEQQKVKTRERESLNPTIRTRTTSSSSGTMVVQNNDDPYVVGDIAVAGTKPSGGSGGSASSRSDSKATTATDSSLGTDSTTAPVSCRRSFEPTCDMYPYVRFWNRQFSPEDCYQSPLRHPNGTDTPI